MHYCLNAITATAGQVVAVSDDAQTCASLGYAEAPPTLGAPLLLPQFPATQGFIVSAAIITVWCLAYVARTGNRVINGS